MLSVCAKRCFDIVVSMTALIVFAPLLIFIWMLVASFVERPGLFRQRRPGFGGQPFEIIKFKTMTSATDRNGNALPDDQRMTKIGSLLRRSSLDELPELWNVLKGDMSLVGPRPLLMSYLPRYSSRQARRHEMRPGVTGWAQINGRNAISWDKKFELDVWYIENQSFWLDIKILFLTVWRVIRKDGISSSDHVTMPEFMGSQADDPVAIARDASEAAKG